MRNLEQRISDAEGVMSDCLSRTRRYESSGKFRKIFSRIFSDITKTNYLSKLELEFLEETDPWMRMIKSLPVDEEVEEFVIIKELNGDIKNFVLSRFRKDEPIESVDSSDLQTKLTFDDGDLVLSLRTSNEARTFDYRIEPDFFSRLEDTERALLLCLPGAIAEINTGEPQTLMGHIDAMHDTGLTTPYNF